MKRLILLLLAGTLVTCKTTTGRWEDKPLVVSDSAMVVSAHPLASRIGIDILKKGGNAVDAAIATQFALAVVFPAAGNIGGGGFLVLRTTSGELHTLDYREKAPALATSDMFLDENMNVIAGLSEATHLASGVPGTVAGLWESHQRFGYLPWRDLVQPSIELALKGFALTRKEARGLNSIQEDLRTNNTILPDFLIRDSWAEGDTIILADLGATLERIRDNGPDGFYRGITADLIVSEMNRGNGKITIEDLQAYRAIWREPVTGQYKGYRIISMGPPSSGGVALLQLLSCIEDHPVRTWGHNDERSIHLFTEAQRRVYADRAAYLGDPDFYDVPVKQLTDPDYIRSRMAGFSPERATPSAGLKEGTLSHYESEQTTHLSVVDAKGNAVAVTTTLNDSYGSKIVVAGAGFILNNEMDDFSLKTGHANMYGALGGEANKVVAHKRMLSSMTPTIVEKDGKLFMVVGTPGGTTIITSVFQTIVNVIDFGMNMQDAVSAGRVHSQWMPDLIEVERDVLDKQTLAALEKKGHRISFRNSIGRVDAIRVREDGKLEGGADPRGDDTAYGF